MGASLTRPEGPPPGEERSYAKQIWLEIVHLYYSLASRRGAAPTSAEHKLVFRREQWVRISDEKIDAPKPGFALIVDPEPPLPTSPGGVRLAYDAKDHLLSDPLVLGVSAGGGDYWLLFR